MPNTSQTIPHASHRSVSRLRAPMCTWSVHVLARSRRAHRLPPVIAYASPLPAAAPVHELSMLAEGGSDGMGSLVAFAVPALLAAGGGVAALRFALYSQLEYVTAAMLTNNIPRGGNGARVIQMGGGTRQLYYYPKSVLAVTAVGPDMNKGLMEQAGIQSAVPTVAKKQPYSDLAFAAAGTADAVVSLGALGVQEPQARAACVQEALRVLRPGGVFIFIERVLEGGSPLRGLLGGTSGAIPTTDLEDLLKQAGGWETVGWDVANQGQDPHVLGLAVRGAVDSDDAKSRRDKQPLSKQKGFSR